MQEKISRLLSEWHLPGYVWNVIIVLSALVIGLLLKLLLSLFVRKKTDTVEKFVLIRAVFQYLGKPLSFLIPLFVFNFLLSMMRLDAAIMHRLSKAVEIALILCFSWTLIQALKVARDFVHHKVNIKKANNLRQRRIITQLLYIRQVANSIIILVTVGAVLLTFNAMRKIGTGLLTGVGIGGIIIGFAAQRSLGNLLAGFQIAFTQPIRIDDQVIVEGEFGWIEEITLTYVVVKIWDDRRLILPINYFIEKPFQNWTRKTADMQGSVFIYTDYSLPVDAVREEFNRLIQNHPAWDKRAAHLQVTNATENGIELRAQISAKNSSDVWDLKVYIRENLIRFIKDKFPASLPKWRAEVSDNNNSGRA